MTQPEALLGSYYANKLVRVVFQELQDLVGRQGLHAVLHLAHLSGLIDNLPPENMDKEFEFAHLSAFLAALEELYGARGGSTLALRLGQAVFTQGLKSYGALAGTSHPAFTALPSATRLGIGLPALVRALNQISDQQVSFKEDDQEYRVSFARCGCCWGRSEADKPLCSFNLGLLRAACKWLSGGLQFMVSESECKAMGDSACVYAIPRRPASSTESLSQVSRTGA